ncbi:MAG TPA: TIGR03435 family protein [Vicinamibacterales bacterium]|nr:TIGR03435 family protein [Vicinamibacterales bacterium]
MRHISICLTLALSLAIAIVGAQGPSAPVDYVASVKRNTSGTGGVIRIRPGNISVNGMPVRVLIRSAYGQLQDFQLVGGPGWINNDRFDIEVKIDSSVPFGPQVVPTGLRQLLEDRFQMKTHKETRELPIFALVLARSDGRLGPNLTPSSPECVDLMSARGRGGPDGRGDPPAERRGGPPPEGRGGPLPADGRGAGRAAGPGPLAFDGPAQCGQRMGGFGRIRAGGNSMAQFADALSGSAQRVVIDKTGLTGYYDFSLTFTPTPDQLPQGPSPPGFEPPPIDPNGPSLFTAMQEQLGLKLQDQRGPVDVVVIDSIEPPTEN